MRHALALLFAIGCSSAVDPPTRCTPGASVPCVCPGVGTGAQLCAADGESYGACVCVVDAGVSDASTSADVAVVVPDAPVMDAVTTEDRPAMVDAAADAVPADDGRDPRCPASAPFMCSNGSCWNLQTSNGMVPALNCGACGRACPIEAPECVSSRCTAPASDAGR